MYEMKKSHRKIFASDLEVKDDDSEEDKKTCQQIRQLFETGLNEENYAEFFHNLLWFEETVQLQQMKKNNMSNVSLSELKKDVYRLHVPGLKDKKPSLRKGDRIIVVPHKENQVFVGEMGCIDKDVVRIKKLDAHRKVGGRRFSEFYFAGARFDIRFCMSRWNLSCLHSAIDKVKPGSLGQCRCFPEENRNVVDVKPISKYFNARIKDNPEQRCAVEHMVANSAGTAPYLLHGPPGTGKTVTIVEAMLQIVLQNPNSRIMVCADSNMAADNVATHIAKFTHLFDNQKLLLRANSQSRVWETLPEALIEHSNNACSKPVPIVEFCSYNIVVTTLAHAASYAGNLGTNRSIGHLFIDEAAQASEPATMIPVSELLAPDGQLVLAGDPQQLGPVCMSYHAKDLGLGLSLMERLKKTCVLYSEERGDARYTMLLRNNFRSDAAILMIPNKFFYDGKLRALAKKDPLSKVAILDVKQRSQAVVFHGVLSKEQRINKSTSFCNDMELKIVQAYITLLIRKHRVNPSDIGVVTPYILQVSKVKSWLAKQKWGNAVEVGSVEAFQGKEKRVIIISTVRGNGSLPNQGDQFQLGFVADHKRFNVALTRAKAKVIVIGNPLLLERDPHWGAYIQQCRSSGSYRGPDDEEDTVDTLTALFKKYNLGKSHKIKNKNRNEKK